MGPIELATVKVKYIVEIFVEGISFPPEVKSCLVDSLVCIHGLPFSMFSEFSTDYSATAVRKNRSKNVVCPI